MKNVHTKITVALVMLLSAGIVALTTNESALAAGDVKLIVNAEVEIDSISAADIKKIMLGSSKKWRGGGKIFIALLKDDDTHEAFTTSITGKTTSQFKSTWKKLVMTGKGIQPKSFDDEAALMAYVAETWGAVGYVKSDTTLDVEGVKELTVN